jgi:predicted DNA-binding transcriptional regulator AlpA
MANDLKSKRLINITRVCEILGVSPSTIHRWVRNRTDFPRPFRLSRGCTRWSEAEIEAWRSDRVA